MEPGFMRVINPALNVS